MKQSTRQTGFTLLELLLSLVILSGLVFVMTSAFQVQQRTYVVVDQVAEAQQNMRVVTDLIERDVRRAGFMVPQNAAVCAYDQTAGPDTLFVSNTDAIRTVYDLEDDNLDISGNFGAPVSNDTSSWDASGSGDTLSLTRKWVDAAADGDDFAVGEGVIVVNKNDDDQPVACGRITSISSNTLTVNFGSTSTGAVGSNADVVVVPAIVYSLNGNELRRNGLLLAQGVEDFQLTYYFDLDDDLVVDAGERFSTAGGTAQPWELTPAANRPDFSTLREVGVNIVTVTSDDDPNRDYRFGSGQVTGNRTSISLPGVDGKRRRVSSTRVRLRNVAG
jgi:prepilin-type N-terminal cleavage/methylation domain-containing protein